MKIDIYTQQGEKKGGTTLPKSVFGAKVNNDLIHRMVVLQNANGRISIAHTLTKGEVRGGGRKPFAQKGGGRARQGSTRSPQMSGGGVAFGPRSNRNYEVAMPKKMRRAALLSALSSRVEDKAYFGLAEYTADAKTKTFASMMTKLPVSRSMLVVIDEKNNNLEKSAKNISNVKVIRANYLNVIDVLRFEKICFVGDSVDMIVDTFANNTNK